MGLRIEEILHAMPQDEPFTVGAVLKAIPDGWAKLDGEWTNDVVILTADQYEGIEQALGPASDDVLAMIFDDEDEDG